MPKVVFALIPNLHVLDLAGPAQVFSTAADHELGYELEYVANSRDVPTAQGLHLTAQVDWPELTPEDLVIIPGWRSPASGGVVPHLGASMSARLVEHHRAGGTVASVCSGAFALGAAGLLDGRRCTTHHDLQAHLARRFPNSVVVPDVLFVEDGRIVTSAGIASGIDLALHLVAVRHGPAAAARIARAMVIYVRRNGDERQDSVYLRHRSHLNDVVHRVQDQIDTRFTERLRLADLASSSGTSVRTLTRQFAMTIGMTPLRYQQTLRLERAQHLIGHGATVEAAAHAVGFEDPRMLRRLRSRAA